MAQNARFFSICQKAKPFFLHGRFVFVYKCPHYMGCDFNAPDTHEKQTLAVYYMRRFLCGQSHVSAERRGWHHLCVE
jgi:hypothetical protein